MTAASKHTVLTSPVPDVLELRDRSPLQQLASAYTERLAAIQAGAGLLDLAGDNERISQLERACVQQVRGSRRRWVDSADFLG